MLMWKNHDITQAVEEKEDDITICYELHDVTDFKSDMCYISREIPIELKISDDHAEFPRGLLGLLADEKEGKLQNNDVNIQTPKNKVKEYEKLKDRREKVKGSFNRNKDGGIIHRFPLQNDPMELHEALGHPSDEILAKMEECLHGVPMRSIVMKKHHLGKERAKNMLEHQHWKAMTKRNLLIRDQQVGGRENSRHLGSVDQVVEVRLSAKSVSLRGRRTDMIQMETKV